ncbi:SAM-dependent DNA methyltransferase, partial [Parapusillimonas sp. SGNA-6]|nr:SAM-dependent DNA methyltransferase [Parapusillimonas sp. SGNA-6]
MRNIFRYLESYSQLPLEVDRLIVSAFLELNELKVINNRLLQDYSIQENQEQGWKSLLKFIGVIQNEIETFDIEKLIELFEFVISPSDRIINGAIYTPSKIREYIIAQSFRREGNR